MQTLNGPWAIAPDAANVGRAEGWFHASRPEAIAAPVPGIIQQALPGYHGVAWYWHTFSVTNELKPSDGRVLLRFGAVDYLAEVWLNGRFLGGSEGGETPFAFDVTDDLRAAGDNVLAVRVLNPTTTPIDGYALEQVPHRNKINFLRPGSPLNFGGILYPVTLRSVPAVRVDDVFARPDPDGGRVAVTVTVVNAGGALASGSLALAIAEAADGGPEVARAAFDAAFPPGTSTHEAVLRVASPRRWDIDDPFLYRLSVEARATGKTSAQTVRIGFRDFRVVDGYFHLNGRRVFVKSTHTGNHMPIGMVVPVNADFGRRDMIYAKASGFNMVRFISGAGYPEQLDLCDELGLMVYEESLAAWLLADSPQMGERFDRNTGDMIRRDRNHACVTIWGLLNETNDGPTFRHAVGYLPKARALDPTRLILLGSGRFDEDLSIGSLSNPGGMTWEHVWGAERPSAQRAEPRALSGNWSGFPPPGYVAGAGDAHVYPQAPLTARVQDFFRDLGRDTKPVFLSEFGIGSLMNVTAEWGRWQQTGEPPLEEGAFLRDQAEALARDWRRLGFDDVYPFPEDLLRESQRLHARQRALGFDLVRRNPQLAGYNLTGMLDHALTGEGLWTFFRDWKPATYDAVAEGWAPLRWCLLADATHVYAGQTVVFEATLANENALRPGSHPAHFRAIGPGGLVWERAANAVVADPAPLATEVLRERVTLNGPPGAYAIGASLSDGAPSGGRLTVHLSDPAALPRLTGEAEVWGLTAKAEGWLDARGLRCRPLAETGGGLILAGLPADSARTPGALVALAARIRGGATAVCLDARLFAEGEDWTAHLPLANRGKAYTATDWLYHKECVARRHPVFEGLQAPGIMDWDYWGPVIPHDLYEGLEAPDDMMAASFTTGHHRYTGGYAWGLLMGGYRLGRGWLFLSTPKLMDHVGAHPAADRLLTNLIRYAQAR